MCIKYRRYFGIQEVLIDTLLATVELWRRVADQVHWETMVVAVKPIETLGIRFHFGFVEKGTFDCRWLDDQDLAARVEGRVQVVGIMVDVLSDLRAESEVSLSEI